MRAAVGASQPVAGRLAFLHPPFALEHVGAAGSAFEANVLMLDYVQRIRVGDGRQEKRDQLETAATVLRRFADAGAAVPRQKGRFGSTSSGLNLASFRGSSELEYGADGAYLFIPGDGGVLTPTCEQNHYGIVADIVTRFDPNTQAFGPAPVGLSGFDAASPRGRGGKAKGV